MTILETFLFQGKWSIIKNNKNQSTTEANEQVVEHPGRAPLSAQRNFRCVAEMCVLGPPE